MKTSAAPQDVDVVVHTHWDREWYLDRETTLARLVVVMSEVVEQLDRGLLSSFLFDGQTVALRDLLAVAPPALQERLRTHAASGALVLGPWFVSADELLVSGESLVRNLEFGIADAAAFGPVQRIGYVVDTFGHTAQMPQILAQFGIEDAVLWRGADAPHDRFDWVAPDGSRVRTSFLTQGYYLNPLHGDDWRDALPALLDKLVLRRVPGSAAPLLLMHGGDHLAPAPFIAERMAEFNAAQDRYRLRVTTLAAHVATAAPAPHTLHGELRHNEQAFVLPDVLSARRDLKRAHQQLEDRLLGAIEPLAVALAAHPPAGIERAWRTLIEQQAHDSICGCSTDAVHAEMAQRFVNLGQQLDTIERALFVQAGQTTAHRFGPLAAGLDVWADDSRCTLFNPLPQRRAGWWTVRLFLRGEAPRALTLADDGGAVLRHAVVAIEAAAELISPLDDAPDRLAGHRIELVLWADLPALGRLPITVVAAAASAADAAPPPPAGREPPRTITNAAWSVECLPDGRMALTDHLGAGRRIEGVFELLAELDAGDSYSFSPPTVHAPPLRQPRWQVVGGQRSGVLQELLLQTECVLPAGLAADRRGAAAETVRAQALLRLRLIADEPALSARLTWQHTARDTRVRLVLPGFGDEVAHSHADSAFAWVQRPVRLVQIPDAPSRREMPVVVFPSLSSVCCGPWTVVHQALHEHEVIEVPASATGQQPAGRALAMTLVRGVGWLSRRDLRTRGVGAGPDIETPGAQCLGDHRFDFALIASAADTADAAREAALVHAAALRRPPLLLRGHARAPQPLPPLDIGNPRVATSSLRRLADGGIELRLWNPGATAEPIALAPDRWKAVRADGQALDAVVGHGGSFVVPPHALLTLRERRREPGSGPA